MTISVASLFAVRTRAQLLALALEVAEDIGLPVTSWQTGDPTRSNYVYLAGALETLETIAVDFIKGGFIGEATGDQLTLAAKQERNVDRVEATYASTTLTLTNASGANYPLEPGDVIAKSTTSDKTYTSTSGGTLAPLGSLTIDIVADEAGAASSAAIGEIDDLVTTLLGVTCSNPVAAVGLDEETDESVRERCDDKLAAFSAAGPRDVYNYVARTPELTGIDTITRARTIHDSDTGEVTVYIADADGAVSGGDVTAVQAAVVEWAAPLCITPTVVSASAVSVPVTYELWIYESVNKTEAEITEAIDDALDLLFASRPIGGDIKAPATTGKLWAALIRGTIRNVFPTETIDVVVTAPAGDTALAIDEVATKGTVTVTDVHFEAPV